MKKSETKITKQISDFVCSKAEASKLDSSFIHIMMIELKRTEAPTKLTPPQDEIDMGGAILLVGPRYQPTGVYFIYYQSASTNEVATYVSVNYACVGFLYTYPGGTPINASSLTYRNTTVEKSNPASNTIYQKMSNFPTSQAIETDSAIPLGGGQFLSFNIVTNLGTYTDGVSF